MVPEERAGQAVKCPKCGKPFRIPAARVSAGAAKRSSVSQPSDPWTELGDDEAPASRSRSRTVRHPRQQARSGGRLVLILVLIGGGVLLAGGVGIAVYVSGVFRGKPAAPVVSNMPGPTNPKPSSLNPPASPLAGIREQLVGKWEGQVKGGSGTLEFHPDGSLTLVMEGGAPIKGNYRVLDNQTVEVRLDVGGQVMTQKLRIEVDKDRLTTTDEMNKVDHFRRSTAVAAAPDNKTPPGAGPKPEPPAAPTGGNPVAFTDPQKVFKANFPGQPQKRTVDNFDYYEVRSPGVVFGINYSDLGDDIFKDVFAGTPREKVGDKILEDFGLVGQGGQYFSKQFLRLANKYPAVDVVFNNALDDGTPAKV